MKIFKYFRGNGLLMCMAFMEKNGYNARLFDEDGKEYEVIEVDNSYGYLNIFGKGMEFAHGISHENLGIKDK